MDRFGGALDSAEDAGLMIVGDEFSEIDGYGRRNESVVADLILFFVFVVVVRDLS